MSGTSATAGARKKQKVAAPQAGGDDSEDDEYEPYDVPSLARLATSFIRRNLDQYLDVLLADGSVPVGVVESILGSKAARLRAVDHVATRGIHASLEAVGATAVLGEVLRLPVAANEVVPEPTGVLRGTRIRPSSHVPGQAMTQTAAAFLVMAAHNSLRSCELDLRIGLWARLMGEMLEAEQESHGDDGSESGSSPVKSATRRGKSRAPTGDMVQQWVRGRETNPPDYCESRAQIEEVEDLWARTTIIYSSKQRAGPSFIHTDSRTFFEVERPGLDPVIIYTLFEGANEGYKWIYSFQVDRWTPQDSDMPQGLRHHLIRAIMPPATNLHPGVAVRRAHAVFSSEKIFRWSGSEDEELAVDDAQALALRGLKASLFEHTGSAPAISDTQFMHFLYYVMDTDNSWLASQFPALLLDDDEFSTD